MTAKQRTAMQKALYLARVSIPQESQGKLDTVIDALAGCWNAQKEDAQAFDFFHVLPWERSEMISRSLYRCHDPEQRILPSDRTFMAQQLKELADAIYAAVARWM